MLQMHLRDLPNEEVQLQQGKCLCVKNQGAALHLPYSVVDVVTSQSKGEAETKIMPDGFNFLTSSCHCPV